MVIFFLFIFYKGEEIGIEGKETLSSGGDS